MLVVDAHLDIAWNALQWNRDQLVPVDTMRTLEIETDGKGRARGTVAFPQLRSGRIALSFATLLARSTGRSEPHIDFGSPYQACAVARGQLAYYRALEEDGHVRVITDSGALDAHIADWEQWERGARPDPDASPPLGFVISMEGADPILSPDRIDEWWVAGLRLLGLTHYGPGRYAGGTRTEEGLTDLGTAILPHLERLGIAVDLTHCSDPAFWETLERYGGPVLASHNNCRALVPHQRQFSDEQLKAIIDRDGVIGAAFDAWMLEPGWIVNKSTPENVTLSTVVDHIDHICQLAGNARHVAIGTDLDGGFGNEQCPRDLDTIADLQKIPDLLAERGYSEADRAAVMHGNWLRFLRRIW